MESAASPQRPSPSSGPLAITNISPQPNKKEDKGLTKWMKNVAEFLSGSQKSSKSERPNFDVYLPSELGGIRIVEELDGNKDGKENQCSSDNKDQTWPSYGPYSSIRNPIKSYYQTNH